MKEILNLKLVILLKYQNIKIFLQTVTLQIGLKKFLGLKKLEILCHGLMLLMVLTEKNCWKFLQKGIAKNKSKGV